MIISATGSPLPSHIKENEMGPPHTHIHEHTNIIQNSHMHKSLLRIVFCPYVHLTVPFLSILNPDPDPHIFLPSGSGSTSQRCGSGSFYHQAKFFFKNLYSYCFVTSFGLFIFEKWCKCTFKKSDYGELHLCGQLPKQHTSEPVYVVVNNSYTVNPICNHNCVQKYTSVYC